MPSGHESNWRNLAMSQLTFVPSHITNVLQFIWICKYAFRGKTKLYLLKSVSGNFCVFFSFNLCHVFPVCVFVKNVAVYKRSEVDKPSTRSQEYRKTGAQMNFQITLKNWLRCLTYMCICKRCVHTFEIMLECCQINKIMHTKWMEVIVR